MCKPTDILYQPHGHVVGGIVVAGEGGIFVPTLATFGPLELTTWVGHIRSLGL